MKNTILNSANKFGALIGFPYNVYPDGTCGKNLCSADGSLPAAMTVKREFSVSSLTSEHLTGTAGEDEDILAHLREIGDKIGYPFYVYADGTCGLSNTSPNKLPFVIKMIRRITVDRIVMANGTSAAITPDSPVNVEKHKPFPPLKQPNAKEREALAQCLSKLKNKRFLAKDEQLTIISFGSEDDIIKLIDLKTFICPENEKAILRRGSKKIFQKLVKKRVFSESCSTMAEYYPDEDILQYVSQYIYPTEITQTLLKNKRYGLLVKLQENESLYAANRLGWYSSHVEEFFAAGHPELLKTQIRKYGKWPERDTLLLIKSRNEEMITYYLDYHELPTKAQIELVELGNKKLIELYNQRYGLASEAAKIAKFRNLI